MHLTGFQMSAFKADIPNVFTDIPTQLTPETKAANEKSERLRSA
jgi:hypothetical protein